MSCIIASLVKQSQQESVYFSNEEIRGKHGSASKAKYNVTFSHWQLVAYWHAPPIVASLHKLLVVSAIQH